MYTHVYTQIYTLYSYTYMHMYTCGRPIPGADPWHPMARLAVNALNKARFMGISVAF